MDLFGGTNPYYVYCRVGSLEIIFRGIDLERVSILSPEKG